MLAKTGGYPAELLVRWYLRLAIAIELCSDRQLFSLDQIIGRNHVCYSRNLAGGHNDRSIYEGLPEHNEELPQVMQTEVLQQLFVPQRSAQLHGPDWRSNGHRFDRVSVV
mgnify:CR=1 FL=1